MSNIDPAMLRQLYIDQQLSIRVIADILHINPRTVHNALIRSRIPRRQRWEQHATLGGARARVDDLDEALLRRLYTVERHSIREIATILNTCPSTVQHALIRYQIPRRKRGHPGKQSAY